MRYNTLHLEQPAFLEYAKRAFRDNRQDLIASQAFIDFKRNYATHAADLLTDVVIGTFPHPKRPRPPKCMSSFPIPE